MDKQLEDAVLNYMALVTKRSMEKLDGIPVVVSTNVPRELLFDYLQLLRTWDAEHGMDSAIAVLGGVPKDELLELFARIVPPFPFMEERTV